LDTSDRLGTGQAALEQLEQQQCKQQQIKRSSSSSTSSSSTSCSSCPPRVIAPGRAPLEAAAAGAGGRLAAVRLY
jgi:hypothetical protein